VRLRSKSWHFPVQREWRVVVWMKAMLFLATSCNEILVMARALDHLVYVVHVPGIFMVSELATETAHHVFAERGQDVLFSHHDAPDPALAALADDGRVWHMLWSDEASLPVHRALVERAEQHVNPGRSRPTRVEMMHGLARGSRPFASPARSASPISTRKPATARDSAACGVSTKAFRSSTTRSFTTPRRNHFLATSLF
jgi:hypothetical protein